MVARVPQTANIHSDKKYFKSRFEHYLRTRKIDNWQNKFPAEQALFSARPVHDFYIAFLVLPVNRVPSPRSFE